MSFVNFIYTAIGTSVLLGFVLFLAKNLILTRLQAAVRGEFDDKLERLKSDLRLKEDSFRAEINAKETEIQAIRTLALSGAGADAVHLADRRRSAVAEVWSAVVELTPFRIASETMKVLNFEETAKEAARNEKFRTAIGAMFPKRDPDETAWKADRARPFISQRSWSLFALFRQIIFFAVTQGKMISSGLGDPKFLTSKSLLESAQIALPDWAAYIDLHQQSSLPYLLPVVEERILDSLTDDLRGKQLDDETVNRATRLNAAITTAIQERVERDVQEAKGQA